MIVPSEPANLEGSQAGSGRARPGQVAQPELFDLVVVGGCGHVGLPLALCFAGAGSRVAVFDVDQAKVDLVGSGRMPFIESGAEELLGQALAQGLITPTSDVSVIGKSDTVVIVIGTPIDEFMNPTTKLFDRAVEQLRPHLRQGALIVLRSTVFPGTTEFVEQRLRGPDLSIHVAFCPERVAEGHALEEIRTLPQIIGATDEVSFELASRLFAKLGVPIIRTSPREAELAKLLTNTWRYMKFAIANQFFQIAHREGVDYDSVLNAIRRDYPRGADLPGPGFAAGPCLLKDTMQLAAFSPDHFPMGHSAMLINEGMPGYIIDTLNHRQSLLGRTVGILGMAFKGDSDDPRTSLSYKLKKLASFKGARVLCTDPYVCDPDLRPLEQVVREADVLIIAAPHTVYRTLDTGGKPTVDIWNLLGHGCNF